MRSLKGKIQNGVIVPDEPIDGENGRVVTILIEEPASIPDTSTVDADWDRLEQLLEECQVETGLSDLAHQHDHYLYGTPKKEAHPE